jgi:hypothetical protein
MITMIVVTIVSVATISVAFTAATAAASTRVSVASLTAAAAFLSNDFARMRSQRVGVVAQPLGAHLEHVTAT